MTKISTLTASMALVLAANAFAGNGDLIVDGKLGVGTATPGAALEVSKTETVNRTDLQDLLIINRPSTVMPYMGSGIGLLFKGNTYHSGSSSYNWARIYSKLNDLYVSTAGSDLVFQTSPLDDGVLSDAMIIRYSGNVGIGTADPRTSLDVNGIIEAYNNNSLADPAVSLGAGARFSLNSGGSSSGNTYAIGLGAGDGNKYPMWFQTGTINGGGYKWYIGTSEVMRIDNSGRVGIGTTSPAYTLDVNGTIRGTNVSPSDIRLKENIGPVESALDKVNTLQGVSYNWKQTDANKNFPTGRHYGVIAQEIEKVLPEVVSTAPDGTKAVAYTEIIPVLIEAIKEQQQRIAMQQQRIDTQQTEIEALKRKLN